MRKRALKKEVRCDALLAVAGNARGNTQFVDSVNALVEAPRGFASISNDAFLLGDHVLELPLEILNEIVAINRVSERAAKCPVDGIGPMAEHEPAQQEQFGLVVDGHPRRQQGEGALEG